MLQAGAGLTKSIPALNKAAALTQLDLADSSLEVSKALVTRSCPH